MPDFKKRFVSYKPSVITYLDILGFRRLVAQRTAGEISRILHDEGKQSRQIRICRQRSNFMSNTFQISPFVY